MVRLAPSGALSANVINSGEFSKLPNSSVASRGVFKCSISFHFFSLRFVLSAFPLCTLVSHTISLVIFTPIDKKNKVRCESGCVVSSAGIITLSLAYRLSGSKPCEEQHEERAKPLQDTGATTKHSLSRTVALSALICSSERAKRVRAALSVCQQQRAGWRQACGWALGPPVLVLAFYTPIPSHFTPLLLCFLHPLSFYLKINSGSYRLI